MNEGHIEGDLLGSEQVSELSQDSWLMVAGGQQLLLASVFSRAQGWPSRTFFLPVLSGLYQ